MYNVDVIDAINDTSDTIEIDNTRTVGHIVSNIILRTNLISQLYKVDNIEFVDTLNNSHYAGSDLFCFSHVPNFEIKTIIINMNENSEESSSDFEQIYFHWAISQLSDHMLNPATIQILSVLASVLFDSSDSSEEDFDLQSIKRCVTAEEFANLKKISYSKYTKSENYKCSNFKEDSCNICLCKYEENDEIILFLQKCEHYFHAQCAKQWLLEESNKCPLCKVEVCPGKLIM